MTTKLAASYTALFAGDGRQKPQRGGQQPWCDPQEVLSSGWVATPWWEEHLLLKARVEEGASKRRQDLGIVGLTTKRCLL